jgi:hypothetical protein
MTGKRRRYGGTGFRSIVGDNQRNRLTAPVEQIAFDIIIAKKVNDEPPREIGFKIDQSPKPGETSQT